MAKRIIIRNPGAVGDVKRALRAFGIKFDTKKLKARKRKTRRNPKRRRKASRSRRRSRRSR